VLALSAPPRLPDLILVTALLLSQGSAENGGDHSASHVPKLAAHQAPDSPHSVVIFPSPFPCSPLSLPFLFSSLRHPSARRRVPHRWPHRAPPRAYQWQRGRRQHGPARGLVRRPRRRGALAAAMPTGRGGARPRRCPAHACRWAVRRPDAGRLRRSAGQPPSPSLSHYPFRIRSSSPRLRVAGVRGRERRKGQQDETIAVCIEIV